MKEQTESPIYKYEKPVTYRIYYESGQQRVINDVLWTSNSGRWMLIGTAEKTHMVNSDKVNQIDAEEWHKEG